MMLGNKENINKVNKQSVSELNHNEIYGELVASERLLQSNNILKNYVISAMALGAVPIPLFDLVSLIGIQVKMVHGLAKHYDTPFKADVFKSLLMSLISGALGVGGVLGMASLSKAFPMLGSLIGGATAASLSGSLTYAVGRVFIWHFEQGGTVLDFDVKKMSALFKYELESGKEVSEDLEDSGVIAEKLPE